MTRTLDPVPDAHCLAVAVGVTVVLSHAFVSIVTKMRHVDLSRENRVRSPKLKNDRRKKIVHKERKKLNGTPWERYVLPTKYIRARVSLDSTLAPGKGQGRSRTTKRQNLVQSERELAPELIAERLLF